MNASSSIGLPDGASPPRALRAGEVGSVLTLIGACYREYGLTLNLDDECEKHLRDPGAHFRAGGGEYWVMTDGEGVVRATVALELDASRTPPGAELKSMYVDRSWRRRGVARGLVWLVMEAAERAGARELVLWSDTRFGAAHALYESMGFVRFGRRDLVDSNGSSEWGYRRALAGERRGPGAGGTL